jgi:hypothetical protein
MKYVRWIEYNDYWSLCTIDYKPDIVACIWKTYYFSYLYDGKTLPTPLPSLTRNAKSIEDGKNIVEEEVEKLGYKILPKELEILL